MMKIEDSRILSEWNDVRPIDTVSRNSHYKADWICSLGHTWKAAVSDRTRGDRGRGCPFCAGKKVLVGFNDLPSFHPHLSNDWDDERDIYSVSKCSGYKAQWKCPKGHSWKAAVYSRVSGNGCPVCAGREVSSLNSIESHPHLVLEWNDERDISTVSKGSEYRAQWKCAEGHSWKAVVYARVRGNGCPKCKRIVSKGETEMAEFIESLGFEVHRNRRDLIPPQEIDAYVPDRRIGFEFNGTYWHSPKFRDPSYHDRKTEKCSEVGIKLIHVWQSDWESGSARRAIEGVLK